MVCKKTVWFGLGLLVLTLGCSEDADSSSNNKTRADDMATFERDMTQASSTSSMTSTTTSTMSTSTQANTGEDMGQGEDMSQGADMAPQGKKLGAGCEKGDECASGFCPQTFIGGVCGECLEDKDCEWGCTPPPLRGVSDVGPSTCNQGQLGDRCLSKEACQGELLCGRNPLTLPFDQESETLTCGECESDAQCPDGEHCAIVNRGTSEPKLAFECVPPDSIELGAICDWEGSGDQACQGVCVSVSLTGMVNLTLGVCSECRDDAMCNQAAGETCKPPEIDLMAATMPKPGRCNAM